jgi:transposase
LITRKLPELASIMEVPKGYVLISEEEFLFLKVNIQLVQELNRKVKLLTEENEQLKQRLNDLENRLNKNSTNSHKPPSTDAFRKPIQNNREKSGKKAGAQNGHKGTTLKMVDDPDQIIKHAVHGFCSCGCNLDELPVKSIRRNQVFDLVPRLIEVTEHRSEIKVCSCGKIHVGDGVTKVAPVRYGERLKAFAVYLSQYEFIPFDRLQEFFQDVFGIRISDGVLTDSNELCFKNLASTELEIKAQLLASQVNHFDETGIRSDKLLEWVHVACNQLFTHFGIHSKRGREAMDAIGILPNFTRVAIHDRFKSYDQYAFINGYCNAHLLRDLKGIDKRSRPWVKVMISLLTRAKKFKEDGRLDSVMIRKIEARYQEIVAMGFKQEPPPKPGKTKRLIRTEAYRLLEMFRDHRIEVLRFVTNPLVPFDNNQAERDIRMVKLKQKISGSFRTHHGGEIFCRIRSYISTARKHGQPVLAAIQLAMNGMPVSFALQTS